MEPPNSPLFNNEDRISNLTEPLILHILSFLDMKYAVQTSVLSRTWRRLWTSVPILNFSFWMFYPPVTKLDDIDGFVDFVTRVLMLRDSSNIQVLNILCDDELNTAKPLNTWIFAAVKHNVQELYVKATVFQNVLLPKCLFTCKSLTKLELDMGNMESSKIILPDSMGLPLLKSLKLASLSLDDENLTNKLFSSCPVLESLIIINSHMNFNFSSLNLKHFKLHNYDDICPSDSMFKTVKLYAPNLTSFYCKDYMSQDYSLENLSSLVTADIDMTIEEEEEDETPEQYFTLGTNLEISYATRMMTYLRALRNVEDLKLSSGFLEFVSGALDYSCPPEFCNLRCLKLKTWVSKNCMNAIIYLLGISPNIESLFLRITDQLDSREVWEAEWSFPYMFNLKLVEIQDFVGNVDEQKFLEILLKKAMVLKEVVLFSFEEYSPNRARWLMEFEKELLTFPRASSSVSISYKYKSKDSSSTE